MNELIAVEVAYATPEKQVIESLQVPPGTVAREAVDLARLTRHFDGLVIDDATPMGIFGRSVSQAHVLRAGDRVEVYRPLIADPKEARRARAQRAREAREQTRE